MMTGNGFHPPGIQNGNKHSHPKLNEDLIEQIGNAVGTYGLNKRRAAALAGVNEHTLIKWVQDAQAQREGGAEPGSTLELRLVQAIEKGIAEFQSHHLNNIKEQSETNWQASAWLLERTSPEEYALKRDPGSQISIDNLKVTTYHQLLMRVVEAEGKAESSPMALPEATEGDTGST